MKAVLAVDGISKSYKIISQRSPIYSTAAESLSHFLKNVFSNKKKKENDIFWALKDISFTIEQGDRVGLIGKNGSGKSTLLKLISQITEPTEGRICIRGRVSSLLEVGTGFHQELSGRENIFLNGAILGMSFKEIKRKFDEIVSFAEIEKFLDTPVKRYSSGMYSRLGFSIAAHLDPDILIVDEVLAVGDSRFQEKCIKKMNQMSHDGRTVIFVSHDIRNIKALCNKGIYLEKGELAYQGSINDCISRYLMTGKIKSSSWEGHEGDEHIAVKKFAIVSSNEKEYFYQNESALLELEYEILEPHPSLVFGFSIFNTQNQLLARSHIVDDWENLEKYTRKGRHKLQFPLKVSYFNDGEYSVRLDCVLHNIKNILSQDIHLTFRVFQEKKNLKFNHFSELGGLLIAKKWKHQEVS